ncbi:MAG: hypothetical protein JWM11_3084 [Planctomycetaceae bacterium]|nr:hypothetical protein [Planctomycetaceae bacterium]
MTQEDSAEAKEIAEVVAAFQTRATGHTPTSVKVVLTEDTLVITLFDALSPAEKAMAQSEEGAAQLQEYHHQLFEDSSQSLREEIKRITGRQVCDSTAEIEPTTGTIVHAFNSGTVVQVFLLTPSIATQT